MNLLSIVFPFKPQRNLLIRKDFNWKQFTFTSNWIYFQVMFLLNFKEVYWQERISIETSLVSIHSNLLSIDFPFKSPKKTPKKLLCTIGYHPNNYIVEDLGHSWGTPLKNCLGDVLNKALIRHLIIWESLHFQGFNRL